MTTEPGEVSGPVHDLDRHVDTGCHQLGGNGGVKPALQMMVGLLRQDESQGFGVATVQQQHPIEGRRNLAGAFGRFLHAGIVTVVEVFHSLHRVPPFAAKWRGNGPPVKATA